MNRFPSDPHDQHDDPVDEAEDNKGNRVDYKLPKPSIFKGEGAPQVPERGGRFNRRPGRGGQTLGLNPYGNGHPFAREGNAEGQGQGGPRPERGGRSRGGRNRGGRGQGGGQGGEPGNRAPRHNDQQVRGPRPQGEQPPRQERGPRPPRPERGPRPEAQPGEAGRPSSAQRPDETRIYGVNACLAAYEKRPESIVRAYVANHVLHRFGYTMKYLAEQRRAYHIVDDRELERITESQHHGGVCFLVRKRVPITLPEFVQLMDGRPVARAVLLDGVGNPHNLGAIVRSCAHFGVDGVLSHDTDALQSGAAARVAEGGVEKVTLVDCADGLRQAFDTLKAAGFSIVATSSHAEADLYTTELPARCVVLVGAEGEGVTPEALEAADLKVRIPGTGAVESLNVSVATGVVLSELARRSPG